VLSIGAIGADSTKPNPSRSRLRVRAFDQATGAALAVRLRAVPRSLLQTTQSWLAGDGALDAALPAGSYQLFVSHGPEWSIDERTLRLGPGQELTVQVPLRREVDAAAFTSCDLHVHTEHSPDSDLPVAQRSAALSAEDVQFVVTTDHNHITDASAALRTAGIASLPGVEVTTWDPEFGHFNVFPRRTAPSFKRTSVASLLRELRADPTAFVQINHPRLEHHIGYFELTQLDPAGALPELGFDGLEVWNGYDLARPWRRDQVFADWLALTARGVRLVATGGSDSHRTGEPFVGYPRTYASVPRAQAHDTSKVLAALKAGRAFVSSGPILQVDVQGHGPGDTLQLASDQTSVHVQVTVDAPGWMDLSSIEIWLGSERVQSVQIEERAQAPRVQLTLDVAVADERSLVVVAQGERGMTALLGNGRAMPYAFSNPLWLHRVASNVAQLSRSGGEVVAND